MWLNLPYASRSISRGFFSFFLSFLPGELEVLGVPSLLSSHILWTTESCLGGPSREHVSSWRGQRRRVLIMHLVKWGRVVSVRDHTPTLSFSSSSDVSFSLKPLQQLLTVDEERENGCITQYPEVWLLSILWNASIQHHHAYHYT